jgi:hypothetical protein
MARRRAIVHVGMPRTGTTTIQRVLFRHRVELARAGVLYPDLTPRSAAAPHLSHQHLGEALDRRRPRAERAELLARLSAQLTASEADVVVLSYEGLVLAPRGLGLARLLADHLARHGFAMEVLVTVKPAAEWLNSTYTWRTQFLREWRPFRDYLRADLGDRRLDLSAMVEPWRSACDGRVRAVPARDARDARCLPLRVLDAMDLAARAGPLLDEADLGLVENRSPGPVAVEAARRLAGAGARRVAGAAARDVTRAIEAEAARRGLDAEPFRGLDPALRRRVAERWARGQERFAATVWGEVWSARVAEGAAEPANEIAAMAAPGEAARHVEEIVRVAAGRFGLPGGAPPLAPSRPLAGRLIRFGRVLLAGRSGRIPP